MRQVAGRFAPSPTGPLHIGSLLAALASFVSAKAKGGRWYVRMDDLDRARVVPGAGERILDTLELFGLAWDGPVLYQSARGSAYACALEQLIAQGSAFYCGCTRRQAHTGPDGLEGPIYPGTCRLGVPADRKPRSVRFRVGSAVIEVHDGVQGTYTQDLANDIGDFVIRRADDVVAYQLATVVDDAYQGITEVVRGADLLSSTPRQCLIAESLGHPAPRYAHVPVVVDAAGVKLGKSNGAIALDRGTVVEQLWCCLSLLGQRPPAALRRGRRNTLLQWATENWNLARVPTILSMQNDGYHRS